MCVGWKTYDGKIKHDRGRLVEIERGSMDENCLCDSKEDGTSNMDVMIIIDEDREALVMCCIGLNDVSGALRCLERDKSCGKAHVKK